MDCARNIITANFSGGGTSATTAPLWQWDYGQVLCITGIDLPAAFEVHFSTNRAGGVSTVAVGADGQVTIPNVLLTIGKNINAWIYLSDSEGDGETEYSILIPVKARPMPETYDAEVSGEFDDVVRQVSEYAETAQTAADNAGASASAAAASADSAAASASAAETAKTAAETAQGKAEDAQAAAETAAQTATGKAEQTAQDAAQAAQSKADAESAAGRAEAAQTGAGSAKTDAETAAQGAAASASAASASATSAGQAATSAAQSATAAAQSAASIEGDVQTATQKAAEATAATGQAVAAKDAAVAAQAGAETAATNAGQSASTATAKAAEAAQSASGAAQSKTDAEAAATRAETAAASLTVDSALSDTSVNPVQNKVVTAEFADVKSQLNASLAGYGKSIASNGMPFVLVNNEYVKQDGQIAPYNGWARTTPIPVMGLESATFAFTNAATSSYCVLYDQNMSFIQQFSIRGETALTIPGNAAFAMVSGNLTNMQQLVVRGLYRDVLNDTVSITAKIRESMAVDTLPFKATDGYYLNNGVATKNANYSMTEKIPIHGIHTLHFDFDGDASARAMFNAFYDATGTFLSAFEATYGVLEVSVPSGAYYVAFSGLTDCINKLSVTLPLEVRVEELEAGATRIKSYYEAEMQTTLETVHALMNEPCLVMPVCTDIHMYSSAYVPLQFDNMIMNMLYFSKHVRIDGVVDLGDNTDGDTVKATSLERAYYMGSEFRKITDKFYFTLGNHDDNRSAAGTTDDFTNAENYQAYYAFVDNSCQFDATYDGTNFYKDFENYKIRLISLNAMANNAYAYSSETIAWFAQTINSTPSDYAVLVISHLAPYGSLNYKGYVSTGAAQIAAALESYKNNGGTIIAFIFGHTHMDYAVTSPFNLIAVASNLIEDFTWSSSDCPPGAVYNPRNPGTATEDLWDVMIIRPHSRKINLVRFGAGSDREFSY